ncbi:MAG TPA: DUF302 domain-containing protein [Candidatus Nanoarchaeia archaeon]|nr:DUF302 domain-containing protein [Candidatus Nanoarchaeia archaeon]
MNNEVFGYRRITIKPFAQAVEDIRESLKTEGFGIITEIDAQKTLKEKIGVEFPQYVILGACNPKLAHQALLSDPEIGLLLPCNVLVYTQGGKTCISAMRPTVFAEHLKDNMTFCKLADEAEKRLKHAVDAAVRT